MRGLPDVNNPRLVILSDLARQKPSTSGGKILLKIGPDTVHSACCFKNCAKVEGFIVRRRHG